MTAICRITLVLFGLVCCAGTSWAQRTSIQAGASVYIEEMDSDLDGFLRAEFVKQNVPLRVVLKRQDAHVVMVGTSAGNEKRSWHEGWLTSEKDHAVGNVTVIDRSSGTMLWAGEAGDRSLLWGAAARGGQRKVAARLVGQLKKSIGPGGVPPPPPPPLSAAELAASHIDSADTTTATRLDGMGQQSPLTNADVMKMQQAGLGEELILSRIQSSPAAFELGTDDLIALKKAGLSDRALSAMLARQNVR
jgi:hypothetical protein